MEDSAILRALNDEQREAVLATEGPVLILAGAGSGKTRVLVHRIAWLIEEKGASPASILAITFTNKAAEEMRKRVDNMIGFGSKSIHVSTFHSLCVRILRQNAEYLGWTGSFSIYDADDQVQLMKRIFEAKKLDPKRIREKAVLARISRAKDELIDPAAFRLEAADFFEETAADLYAEYQKRLKENNAMDFDDLIMKTVELFERNPEVLEFYQNRFVYVMVDEYQDTNTAQFRLISLLAERSRNLCVVGDDDQSIYKFRGANIRNILNFESFFPDARVVKLERNYRSTQKILDAANEVIRHNHGRKAKRLWTDNGEGKQVRLRRFATGFEEASFVAREISAAVRGGSRQYSDFAVLYRTNAQSRLFEEKFLLENVPYRIVGGVNFYSRKEIKDVLAYLKTIDNAADDLMVARIINTPKRGIGAATVGRASAYAEAGGISLFDACCEADRVPALSASAAKKVSGFAALIGTLRAEAETMKISELVRSVLERSGYMAELTAEDTDEARARTENINEFISKAVQYETDAESPSLSGFLEEVALIADIDAVEDDDDRVLLMTLHSAKGLEFPSVFMSGMEEGLFPSQMSIRADDPEAEIEEERRLAYVGITRAKEELTFTCARERMLRGEMVTSALSRFVREIPREMVDSGEAAGLSRIARMPSARTVSPRLTREYETGAVRSGVNETLRKAITQPLDPGSLTAGQRVRHVKFGEGVIREVSLSGRKHMVVVDFPSWGTKRLLAEYANLEKAD